jgi:hypothetical protein
MLPSIAPMSDSIQFRCSGALPPELVKGKSIWGSDRQSLRILRARKAALTAMDGRELLTGPLSFQVVIQAGRTRFDLDHVVAALGNICAAAPPRSGLAKLWHNPANADVWPMIPLVYLDDKQIKRIHAELLDPDGSKPSGYWYSVRIEQLGVPRVRAKAVREVRGR